VGKSFPEVLAASNTIVSMIKWVGTGRGSLQADWVSKCCPKETAGGLRGGEIAPR